MRAFRVCCFVVLAAWMPATGAARAAVPDWGRDAIWYQIFPERYRNGDPSNDPTAQQLGFAPSRDWHVSPWTNDWYALQPWERRRGARFYDNVFDRRYGGDLQGIIDQLDYLQGLGITAIYLNPIFEAYSLHKYDASTLHHVDKNFGPDPAGDLALVQNETDDPASWKWTSADRLFLKLIREVHRRGMKIIIDGVFNHTGTRFWAFRDVVKNQQKSPYADWYKILRWDDPSTPQNEFAYQGWFNVRDLPEFRQDANGIVHGPREYIFRITERWMSPEGHAGDGVDGWRLDVANQIAPGFWRDWRKLVKNINPNAIIFGEIWGDASSWLHGDQFDGVMNYGFAKLAVRYFIDTGTNHPATTQFDQELASLRARYPEDVDYVLQNLYDSHDTDRLPSMIRNPNRRYDQNGSPRNNPLFRIDKPSLEDRRIQRLMALFQMSYLGAPMIYYGDEAGMWGADDPDDRKPMLWPDLHYAPESTDPFGRPRSPDPVAFDKELHDYYAKLISVRRANVALRRGTFKTLLADNQQNVFAFARSSSGNEVIVVLNNANQPAEPRLQLKGGFRDAISGEQLRDQAGVLSVRLSAKSGVILVRESGIVNRE